MQTIKKRLALIPRRDLYWVNTRCLLSAVIKLCVYNNRNIYYVKGISIDNTFDN